jgi:hypothetical protein
MYNETENSMDVRTSIISCENKILAGNISFVLNTMFGKVLVEVNPPEETFEFMHPTKVFEFKNAPMTSIVKSAEGKFDFYIAMRITGNRITDHYVIIEGLVHTILLSMGLSDNVDLAIDNDVVDAATLSYVLNCDSPVLPNERLTEEVIKLNFKLFQRRKPVIIKMVNEMISTRRDHAEKIITWANRSYDDHIKAEYEQMIAEGREYKDTKWINVFSKELYAIALYTQKEYTANVKDIQSSLLAIKEIEDENNSKQNIPAYKNAEEEIVEGE